MTPEQNTDQIKISESYIAGYLKALSIYSDRIRYIGTTEIDSQTSNAQLLAYIFEPLEEVRKIIEELETDNNHPSFQDVFYQHNQFMKKAGELKRKGWR